MLYHCNNPKCTNPNMDKLFVHPVKILTVKDWHFPTPNVLMPSVTVEEYACPYCHSLSFVEIEKPKENILEMFDAPDVAAVNAKLALNEGWRVLSEYAKFIRMARYPVEVVEQKSLDEVFKEGIAATKGVSEDTMKQAEAAYQKLDGDKS